MTEDHIFADQDDLVEDEDLFDGEVEDVLVELVVQELPVMLDDEELWLGPTDA